MECFYVGEGIWKYLGMFCMRRHYWQLVKGGQIC